MNINLLREKYSLSEQGAWDDWSDGTWLAMERYVPVGKSQFDPELGWFSKEAEKLDYDCEDGGGQVWMILSWGSTDGVEVYYKIEGYKDSYGNSSWNHDPVRVQRKTRTEVFYE